MNNCVLKDNVEQTKLYNINYHISVSTTQYYCIEPYNKYGC